MRTKFVAGILSTAAMMLAVPAGAQAPLTSNEYGHDDRAPNAVKVGEIAPDFTLPSADGGSVTLSRLAASGEVVLVFHRGSW